MTPTTDRPSPTVFVRIYRFFLLVYPAAFRADCAKEMIETVGDREAELLRRVGWFRMLRFRSRELLAVGRTGLRLRLGKTKMRTSGWRRRLAAGEHPTSEGAISGERWANAITVWQDLRYAKRSMRAAPGFTAVVVFVLAIGIAANVAMFSTMNAALIKPLPFPNPQRLVLGRATFSGNINPVASAEDYYDYRDRSDAFESLATILFGPLSHTVTGGDEPERVSGIYVSWDLFRTLGISPQLGRHLGSIRPR